MGAEEKVSERFSGKSEAGLYGDTVEEVDWSVGQIIKKLENHHLCENTLIIFTSDNGPWYIGNPGPKRGRKNDVFEGGFLVPFIARWLETIPAGQTRDQICIGFDLFATCLEIAGTKPPQDRVIDGKNILSLLQFNQPSPHSEFFYILGRRVQAVRQGNWKYHSKHSIQDAKFPLKQGPYLFDLNIDYNESYSLVETQPALVRSLQQIIDEMSAKLNDNPRGWLENKEF